MLHPIDISALDAFGADEPVFMLNLLRFAGDEGRRAYFEDYVGAFRALAAELGVEGIEPVWNAVVGGTVAGPDGEVWDGLLVVRYPSPGSFRLIVDSDAYRTRVAPHREGAVLDWRLIAHRPR